MAQIRLIKTIVREMEYNDSGWMTKEKTTIIETEDGGMGGGKEEEEEGTDAGN